MNRPLDGPRDSSPQWMLVAGVVVATTLQYGLANIAFLHQSMPGAAAVLVIAALRGPLWAIAAAIPVLLVGVIFGEMAPGSALLHALIPPILVIVRDVRGWSFALAGVLAYMLAAGGLMLAIRVGLDLIEIEVLVMAVVGVASMVLADELRRLLPHQMSHPENELKRPIRRIVLGGMAYVGLVPALIASLVGAILIQRQAEVQVEASQQQFAQLAAHATSVFIDDRLANLSLLSERVDVSMSAERRWEFLSAYASEFPEARSLIITDADGLIESLYFSGDMSTDLAFLEQPQMASDREYFRQAMTGRRFASDVFRGRGLGRLFIVALAVPIVRDGNVVGILEASIDVQAFAGFLPISAGAASEEFTIVDSAGNLVATSLPIELEALTNVSEIDTDDYQILERRIGDLGWRVVALQPNRIAVEMARPYLYLVLLILLAVVAMIALAAHRLGEQVASPLERLAANLKNRIDSSDQLRWLPIQVGTDAPAEFHHAADQANSLLQRLKQGSDVQQDLVDDRDHLNRQLEQTIRLRDITIEQRTRELGQALDLANHAIRRKNDFMATTSHEVKTPIHSVIGMAELLATTDLTDDQGEHVRMILQSAENIFRLVDEIMDFSTIEAGRLQIALAACHLATVLEQCVATLRGQFLADDRRIALEVDSSCDQWVRLDAGRVQQIVLNLLQNAYKHGGSSAVTVSAQRIGGEIEIRVSDQGPGVPVARRELVFEPFEQLDTGHGKPAGSGLGLAVSRRLAELMEGALEFCQEAPADETCLVLTLPDRPVATPSDTSAAGASTVDRPGIGTRVLVADDNLVNRRLLGRQLKFLGFQAIEAEDGRQAVESFNADPCQVVFLDCQMPVMSGFDAARRIRESSRATIPMIVAVTASTGPELQAQCDAAGFDEIVTKPARLDDIKAILSRLNHGPDLAVDQRLEPSEALLDRSALSHWEKVAGERFARDMLVPLVDQLEQLTASLNELSHAGELSRIGDEAHRFRGKLATVGVPALADWFGKLESQAIQGNHQEVSQMLSDTKLIDRTAVAIRAYLRGATA